MLHNNDSVRNKLIEITNQGLMLKSIALNVGVDVNDLSRFKGGMDCLEQSDVEILSEYLNEVHIPQWKTVTKEKPMTMRERLLASKNKQNKEKPKRRRSNVSLDLLNELES
ncbi:hypothetical protein D7X88_17875 [bacterium C-53]|nr:hypothetical protein [Lachnospiraceae bacterium]NBI04812.1 hypothetical protein [Lachnospiraceae bacterium]RKJ07722.1 hypothetical protein D7X88_17875 [bacterium C-53]